MSDKVNFLHHPRLTLGGGGGEGEIYDNATD